MHHSDLEIAPCSHYSSVWRDEDDGITLEDYKALPPASFFQSSKEKINTIVSSGLSAISNTVTTVTGILGQSPPPPAIADKAESEREEGKESNGIRAMGESGLKRMAKSGFSFAFSSLSSFSAASSFAAMPAAGGGKRRRETEIDQDLNESNCSTLDDSLNRSHHAADADMGGVGGEGGILNDSYDDSYDEVFESKRKMRKIGA